MRPQIIPRFIIIFLNWLYHDLAIFYDTVAAVVSFGQWKNWTYSVIPMIHGRRVLELGFGPGHLLKKLVELNYQLIGVDASQQMIRLATKRLSCATPPKGSSHSQKPNIARAFSQNLPFPTQVFDTVISTFPSEYIYDHKTLYEVYRILKDTGTLIILLYSNPSEKSLFTRLLAKLYKITGEIPQDISKTNAIFIQRLIEIGFSIEEHEIQTKNSALYVLKAIKMF